MSTDYTEQFYTIDPANPPVWNSYLGVTTGPRPDVDDTNFISPGDLYNGSVITSVWDGDTVTVRIPGQGTETITGVTFYVQGQPSVFTPTDGTILEDGRYRAATYVNTSTQVPVGELGPPCFTPGTRIETADGPRAVEDIAAGDLVLTADDGLQPVLWVRRCRVAARGAYAPVRIAAGALGNDRDLTVSPQHRILVEGWAAELYAGQDAVLVPAIHLVDGDKVRVIEGGEVEYLHLAFETHALVRSEGIWSESHFATAAARAEAEALMGGTGPAAQLARPATRRHESRAIAASVLS